MWNSLPASVNFASLTSFKRSLTCVDAGYLIERCIAVCSLGFCVL